MRGVANKEGRVGHRAGACNPPPALRGQACDRPACPRRPVGRAGTPVGAAVGARGVERRHAVGDAVVARVVVNARAELVRHRRASVRPPPPAAPPCQTAVGAKDGGRPKAYAAEPYRHRRVI